MLSIFGIMTGAISGIFIGVLLIHRRFNLSNFLKKFFTFDFKKVYYNVVENERDEINRKIIELLEERNKLEEMLGYR